MASDPNVDPPASDSVWLVKNAECAGHDWKQGSGGSHLLDSGSDLFAPATKDFVAASILAVVIFIAVWLRRLRQVDKQARQSARQSNSDTGIALVCLRESPASMSSGR